MPYEELIVDKGRRAAIVERSILLVNRRDCLKSEKRKPIPPVELNLHTIRIRPGVGREHERAARRRVLEIGQPRGREGADQDRRI